jgi:hypothetical protein
MRFDSGIMSSTFMSPDEDMSRYQPPLTLTTNMLSLIAEISEQIGQLTAVDDRQQTLSCVAAIGFERFRRLWPSRTIPSALSR